MTPTSHHHSANAAVVVILVAIVLAVGTIVWMIVMGR
jgi:hypothetical protein